VYGPSASVLLALSQAHAADTARREVLAVGDPEGDRSLPYAAEEARDVYGLFDARRSDLLIGGRATLGRWRALDPGRYRYLHFAAHTMLERDPDRAELRLADGRLAPADIGRLRLQARLVALSACETARGRRVRGEGVIGLPYAFLAAGARDVLMSLWRVSDRSAAEFMEAFYRELRAGASAEEALRRVREAALRQPGRHPAEWASFVLFGAPEVAVETSP
jgi:CHAT domain-containing protein